MADAAFEARADPARLLRVRCAGGCCVFAAQVLCGPRRGAALVWQQVQRLGYGRQLVVEIRTLEALGVLHESVCAHDGPNQQGVPAAAAGTTQHRHHNSMTSALVWKRY